MSLPYALNGASMYPSFAEPNFWPTMQDKFPVEYAYLTQFVDFFRNRRAGALVIATIDRENFLGKALLFLERIGLIQLRDPKVSIVSQAQKECVLTEVGKIVLLDPTAP